MCQKSWETFMEDMFKQIEREFWAENPLLSNLNEIPKNRICFFLGLKAGGNPIKEINHKFLEVALVSNISVRGRP